VAPGVDCWFDTSDLSPAERERETWIIGMQHRVLMRERQIVHNGAWIISMSDRVLTLVEFVCWSVSLSSERDRQTEKQFESAIWKTESRVSTMITDDTRFGLKCLALFIRVHAERERQSLTGQWHLLLTVDVTVCQEVMVGNEWTVKERKRDSRETCQWSWSRRKDEQYMIKRMWKNHMRDRETIRAGVWIIGMQDRVSSDTRFGLKFLSLFICVHASSAHQTECQVSTSIQCHWWISHWWINTRVWLSLIHDTRAWLTMTSLLSLNVKSFKCRKSVQSFNLEVFVKTSTCTDSHRLCQDFYMHRLPPLPPKTKKQIFYKFVRSFASFCWTCSFQVHVLFLRHWGWYQMTKKKKQVGSASDS
jgi:hypothetical protein